MTKLTTENMAILKKAINEGVDAKLQEASAKDLLKSIIEVTKAKLGGKELDLDLRGLIDKTYDKAYANGKFLKDKDKVEAIYEVLDVMSESE